MQEARIHCKWGPDLYQATGNSCAAFFSSLHLHLGLRIPKRWHHQQLLEWISNTYQARDDPLKLIHRASKETTRYDRQIKKVRLGWTLQKRAQTPHGRYFWSN